MVIQTPGSEEFLKDVKGAKLKEDHGPSGATQERDS